MSEQKPQIGIRWSFTETPDAATEETVARCEALCSDLTDALAAALHDSDASISRIVITWPPVLEGGAK